MINCLSNQGHNECDYATVYVEMRLSVKVHTHQWKIDLWCVFSHGGEGESGQTPLFVQTHMNAIH